MDALEDEVDFEKVLCSLVLLPTGSLVAWVDEAVRLRERGEQGLARAIALEDALRNELSRRESARSQTMKGGSR